MTDTASHDAQIRLHAIFQMLPVLLLKKRKPIDLEHETPTHYPRMVRVYSMVCMYNGGARRGALTGGNGLHATLQVYRQ